MWRARRIAWFAALGVAALTGLRAAGAPEDALSRSAPLDAASLRCLECHPQRIAPEDLHLGGIAVDRTEHPVGRPYAEAWLERPDELRPLAGLSPLIVLPGGRITCVSCHAPGRAASAPAGACPESQGLTLPPALLCQECHAL